MHEAPFIFKPHKRRKKLALVITASGEVEVRTPPQVSYTTALKFYNQHKLWVERQRQQRRLAPSVPVKTMAYIFGREVNALDASQLIDRDQQLTRMIDSMIPTALMRLGITANKLTHWRLRTMKTRWGSCSSNGTIRFSRMLGERNEQEIFYVVVHELAHLQEMNHSRAFWLLVEKACPNWRKQRHTLKSTPSL